MDVYLIRRWPASQFSSRTNFPSGTSMVRSSPRAPSVAPRRGRGSAAHTEVSAIGDSDGDLVAKPSSLVSAHADVPDFPRDVNLRRLASFLVCPARDVSGDTYPSWAAVDGRTPIAGRSHVGSRRVAASQPSAATLRYSSSRSAPAPYCGYCASLRAMHLQRSAGQCRAKYLASTLCRIN
jgi:hypothetical protein